MDKKGKGDKRRQKETLQLWFRSVTSDSLNSLRRVQASSNILLKNNVISHLYVQITWSLVRIYLGLDSRNANLWVLGCVQISDPIKALIEGRMKERGKEQRGMKSRMEGRSVFWGPVVQRLQTPSPTLLVPSHLSPFGQTSISLFFFFKYFFFSSCHFLSLFSPLRCLFLFVIVLYSLRRSIPHTTHIQFDQLNKKEKENYNSLTSGWTISISSLLTAQNPFWNKASQFSDCKENPLDHLKELICEEKSFRSLSASANP